MTKIDVMNTVAKNHGWKNWDDLFWSGDISQAIIDDLMQFWAIETANQAYKQGYSKGFDEGRE